MKSQRKLQQTEPRILKDSESAASTQAYLRGVSLLAQRDHSSAELGRKLSARGYSAEVIDEAIKKLTNEGYLDDRRFARSWTEYAIRSGRGYGIRILQDLSRKGISREIALQAIENATAEYPEYDSLATIVSRRFSAFDPSIAPRKEKQRVYSYLQRRGFSLHSITSFFLNKDKEFDR